MKLGTLTIILSALALTTSVAVGLLIFGLSSQVRDIEKNSYITQSLNSYETKKLSFCLAEAITLCDDERIAEWNSANSEGAFVIKSYEILVNEGIDAYDASQR